MKILTFMGMLGCLVVSRALSSHSVLQPRRDAIRTLPMKSVPYPAPASLCPLWSRISQGDVWDDGFGGENPGPGRPERNWDQCVVDDLLVFRATEGSTESVPLVFGVETVLLTTAAMKGGKWYRGVVERRNVS